MSFYRAPKVSDDEVCTNLVVNQTAKVAGDIQVLGSYVSDVVAGGYKYTGTLTVSGAGTPRTLNARVGSVTFTGVSDIAAGASSTLVINNTYAGTTSVGIVSLQTTTAAAGSTPRVESVVYTAGVITVVLRNSAAATATGSANYSLSFQLFN